MANYQTFKLKNGVEVLTVPQKSSFTTTVMVTSKVGSKYESKDQSGISHFLEHLGFKGTKKRPDQVAVASELENLGASYNAFTSKELTSYYAKGRAGIWKDLMDVISDIYINSTLPEEEIEKERGVIIEEFNMYEDNPRSKVGRLIYKVLYGDQPAGRLVLGDRDVVKKLQRKDFVEYRKKHYTAPNTLIVIAGDLESDIKKTTEEFFNEVPGGEKYSVPEVVEKQDKPQEIIDFKDSDQTHFVMGFRAFNSSDERKYALKVLADALGGGISSRLFQKIRSEMGAAYYVSAGSSLLSNHGFFYANAGVSNDKVEDAIRGTLKEVQKVKEEGITKEELEKSKNHMIGNLFTGLETSSSLARFYTFQAVKDKEILSPEKIKNKINEVTLKDVQSVAKDIFQNDKLNLALIGPFKEKTFGDILQIG